MAFKGWFLLILFLFLQVGALVASAGPVESRTFPMGGSSCSHDSCCCAEESEASSRCGCAEAPRSGDQPSPVIPSAPAAGRDLLPVPIWSDVRSCERPPVALRPARLRLQPTAAAPTMPVALRVRFCAFLI